MDLVTGVDIVDIDRIDKIFNKLGHGFLNKIFTDTEINYIRSKNYKVETIAGLFAAKEAISKAIGTGIGRVRWKEIKIEHDRLGRPVIKNEDLLLEKFKIKNLSLSISHEKKYAVAFTVGYKVK